MDQIADEPEDQDFMLNCSATNSVIEEQLEVISNKIKLYETKFKNKTLKFGGYEEMEAHLNPEKIENFKKELSNDLKRKLSQAITMENFVAIEEILALPEANINMTWFSENLLMCAIRNKKPKICELFIDKGIDILYRVEMKEFKQVAPLNSSEYSCRSMAYDKELFNIVDLIDIFDTSTDPKIVKYLAERYLRENFKEEKPPDEANEMYENRLATDFAAENAEMPSIVITETESRKKLDSQSELIEQTFHIEAEEARPSSNLSNFLKLDKPLRKSSISTESIISNQPIVDPLRTDKQIVDELNASLIQKLKEKLETTNQALRDALNQSRMSNHSDIKTFKYSGYKVNLEMKKTNELLPPILCSSLNNHMIKPSKEVINLKPQNEIEIKKVFKPNETVAQVDLEKIQTNKKVNFNELPSLLRNVKPVIKSDLIVFQYEDDQKYYYKNKATDDDTFEMNDQKYARNTWDKHLPKIKNYYYINSLKRIPAAHEILIDSLSKYSEPLFPMLQAKKANPEIESTTNVSSKPLLSKPIKKVMFNEESNTTFVKRHGEEMPTKFSYKTNTQINEQYLKSLKASGLINKNCKPVVRSSSLKINFNNHLNF